MLLSVVAANLEIVRFKFSKEKLFFLITLPALTGTALRILYSFLTLTFGGRRFTASSSAGLLIPIVGMSFTF
jgi:NNP family nitrate/nitrite transporter-like MFS transporter